MGPQSYLLGFNMHGRLTEDQRTLDEGDDLDPEIPQTPVTSVYRGQRTSFIIFRYVFRPNRPEMSGELLFGAYIRILLNRGQVLVLNMEEMRAFPLAGTWRRQQSNPLSNPVNSRREIADLTWPFCCLLSKNSKKNI